jgi:hypothetical protein
VTAALGRVIEVWSDLDSHADTCCLGSEVMEITDYQKTVTVTGFDPTIASMSLRIISAALAYDSPESGETVILLVHQAIYNPNVQYNLLCPLQLRTNDVTVNERPKFLTVNPTDEDHSIIVRSPGEDEFRIPLAIRGTTSSFPTRKPTAEEYSECRHIELTYDDPTWDPSTKSYAEQEEAMVDNAGRLLEKGDQSTYRYIESVSTEASRASARTIAHISSKETAVLLDIDPRLCESEFSQQLHENVIISSVSAASSSQRKNRVDASLLARNWGIGLEAAAKTVRVTTQKGSRTTLHPSLARRAKTNDRHIRYKRLSRNLYGDLLESKVLSRRMNKYSHIFAADNGWCRAYGLKKKSEAPEALSVLFNRDGVPPVMIVDGGRELVSDDYKKRVREAGSEHRQTLPRSQWMNTAEGSIRELKKETGRAMIATGTPKRLWDDCLEYRAYVRSNTALNIYELDGQVPETVMKGQQADISPWCDFQWYQWVKYYDERASFPEDKQILGKYLGPSPGVGTHMTTKILTKDGSYFHTLTFRPLNSKEMEEEHPQREAFLAQVEQRLGDKSKSDDFDSDLELDKYDLEPYEDNDDGGIDQMPDREEQQFEHFDQYLNSEVLLARKDKMTTGKVKSRKRTADGSLRGTGDTNPILDTRSYMVEFPDGSEAEYSANVLAENMYAQCDADGNQFLLMEAVTDHRKTKHAVELGDETFQWNGKEHLKRTTKGWEFCIQWRDGTTTWERLAELKESNPVEIAEYTVAAGIDHMPAFKWWIPYTLKKRTRILAAVNQRYQKRTHKFGIRVPKTVEEALQIDRTNGNRMWEDALDKEMGNVRVAFNILPQGQQAPIAHTKIRTHIIFDVKMETLRRKCRLVAGGHVTESPHPSLTYASVVSRESVRIALTLAALNDLQVKAADIQNAYLTAPLLNEKIWTVCGAEFGEDQGKHAVVVRALYGLKSAGHDYGIHIANCMVHLGYTPCEADRDVWMKPMVRPDDKLEYFAYALLYVDDILMIHHDGIAAIDKIDKYFKMKPDTNPNGKYEPDFYLGAKFKKVFVEKHGVWAYSLSPSKYVNENIRLVEEYLSEKYGQKLRHGKRLGSAPFPNGYRAETDLSEELPAEEASYYHSQIGILRWMVELGRIDIITEVSMLASHLALPRRGHLEAVFAVYAFLKNKHNSTMVFDPSYPEIDEGVFVNCDWKDYYPGAKEQISPNAPEPRGKEVDLRMYVDSDHAGDQTTRRSRTGYIIYVNSAPVIWHSKKQTRVETSVFGAEFCAMTQGIERLRGLRYKLRMMGVEISGPSYVYGDNMSVIYNTQKPSSRLNKKSNSICYHACREAVASGEVRTGHVRSEKNPADICTKIIAGGMLRTSLTRMVLHDI